VGKKSGKKRKKKKRVTDEECKTASGGRIRDNAGEQDGWSEGKYYAIDSVIRGGKAKKAIQ